MDRIDIHIEVTPVPFDKLSDERPSSVDIRKELLRLENYNQFDLANEEYSLQCK
jgi:magnesium chelatase family protein